MHFRRYHLSFPQGVGTPLESDTLSGQWLCFYRERYGLEALQSLIARMREGYLPFIFSNAFPQGFLPFPLLPALTRQELKTRYPGLPQAEWLEKLQQYKSFKKQTWISVTDWLRFRHQLSLAALFEQFPQASKPSPELRQLELHNIIDRHTGRSLEENGLFTTEVEYANTGFDLYAQVHPEFTAEFDQLLADFRIQGFGRDRSVGKGALEIKEDQAGQAEVEQLFRLDSPSAWLNLSNYACTQAQGLRSPSYYRLQSKLGKVWNGFGEMNPFKWPLLTFGAGSLFPAQPLPLQSTLIFGVHANPEIFQYSTPLMLPCLLAQEEAPCP